MDVSIIDHSDVEKEMHVTLAQEELQPHFERAYKREQAKIEIKGFRKGKAPLEMIKRFYGEAIEYEALDDIANDVFKTILKEKNIFPLGEPALTDMKFKPGEPLTFSVKYEVQPKVELNEYKRIAVEKLVHHVTDDDVEDEIYRISKANSTFTEVQAATDDEHIVTIDIQELDDNGSPLIGRKSAGTRLYLNDEQISPEVRYALQNVALNEHRRVNFEMQHGDHKHLNHWEMTVTKIEKVTIPELTDEFVKKATKLKVSTVDEFRANVRKDIERYFTESSEQQLKDDIIGEIVRRHDFKVPQAMVKGLTDARIEDIRTQSPNKKLPDDFDEKKFREQYTPYAIFQAKWYLIKDRIVEQEQLHVTDAELEKRAEEDAPKMSIEKERLLAFYKSSDALKDRIMYDKLMNFLIGQAVITEKLYQPDEQESELVA
ncbi:MAG: trigger factor [Bacteroidetes bacterium]|nr:MAG: trigger factor [Bacteroidota bacterium]